MEPAELDRLLDRELEALPQPRAPRTLLPRVLEATVARARTEATGWSTWPVAWRAGSLAVFAVLAAAAWLLIAAPPRPVANWTRTLGETATVVRVVYQLLLQPVATYMLGIGLTLALACAAAWAAFELALGETSHQ